MNLLQTMFRRVRAYIARNRHDTRHDPLPPSAAGDLPVVPLHADERTIRRLAEAELGGKSSDESRAAYLRGDLAGGIHRGGRGPAPIHRRDRESGGSQPVLDLSEPIFDNAPPSSVSHR